MLEREENYERDGVQYEITVDSAERGYFGHWLCPDCRTTGSSSVKDDSVAKAVIGAKTNLSGHPFLCAIAIFGISVGIASADTRYTIDFNGRPGPSGIPGAADQILYTVADITNFDGYRNVSEDFAGVGIHFGANTSLDEIGGGFNPDGSSHSGDNIVLADFLPNNSTNYPQTIQFDIPQTNVSLDLLDYIDVSGSSNPITLKLGGSVVDSFTLTAADAVTGGLESGEQLDASFDIDPGITFDEIDLALTGPSDGGFSIDNVEFDGNSVPEPASLCVLCLGSLGLLARRRKA